MSIKHGFFNSKNGDRVYSALDITSYFDKIIGNGVFVNPANSLQIMAGDGLNVICKAGKGWIDGFFMINDADLILTLNAADVSLDRIDRIVFKLDKTNRNMSIVIKTGTPASSPVAPEIIRNATVQEYSLATIRIAKQTKAITQAAITDTRLDSRVCGKVASLIDQLDTSDLYDQWQDAFTRYFEDSTKQFNTWFSEVKDTLSTAIVLQQYESSYTTTEDNVTEIPINIANFAWGADILEVYINGMRVIEPVHYTSTSDRIILTNAVTKDTEFNFVVLKNVDGTDAEAVVTQVADLQTRVAALENYVYEATRSE